MKNLIILIFLLFSLNSFGESTKLTKNCISEYNKTSSIKLDSTNLNFTYTPNANWQMIIGHNVIVPVTSSKKSFPNGVSSKNFTQYYVEKGLEDKVNNFTKNTGTVIEQSEINSKLETDIVFCRLEDIQNLIIDGSVTLIPIDKNQNGKIDSFENIYGNLDNFLRGVWVGKYPSELTDNIYAVSAKKPNENESVFLTWVMNSNALNSNGYSNIISSEKNTNLAILAPEVIEPQYKYKNIFETKGSEYVAIIFFFLLLIPFWFFLNKPVSEKKEVKLVFLPESLKSPKGFFYAENHTWTHLDKLGVAKVGLDDFIARIVGEVDVKFFKKPGESIHKGELVAELVQQNKSLKVYSPISGDILKVNSSLDENNLLNIDPYDGGWLLSVTPNDWIHDIYKYKFLDNSTYWLKSEFAKFKDFISTQSQSLVLQDGGELQKDIFEKSSDEIWKEFENKFMTIE